MSQQVDLHLRISAVCTGQKFILKSLKRLGACAANVVFEHEGGVVQIARIRVPEPIAEYIEPEEVEMLLTYRALREGKAFARGRGLGAN